MNVRNGFLRLWIVFSVLFGLAVCASSYSSIRRDFELSAEPPDFHDALAKRYGGEILLPVDCYKARGTATVDYRIDNGHCWYEVRAFRRVYPEYADRADVGLSYDLYAKAGLKLTAPQPWKRVLRTAGVVVGLPLAVLAGGWAVGWVAAGFRRE